MPVRIPTPRSLAVAAILGAALCSCELLAGVHDDSPPAPFGGSSSSSASSSSSSGLASSAGTSSGAGGSGGARGTGGGLATCDVGARCDVANGEGLCDGFSCQPCVDTTDDASCATIYGAGNICLEGACAPGCRTSLDCTVGPCVASQCTGCESDGDCITTPATPICDTGTTHTCVGAACSETTGSPCATNAADLCCSGTCVPEANCCGAGSCAISGVAGTCVSGTCTRPSCPAVTGNTLYVDGNAVSSGNGASPGCAHRTILAALAKVAGPGPWTVILRGGFTYGASAAHVVPANVTVTGGTIGTGAGSSSSFAACANTTICPESDWPVVVAPTANVTAFTFPTAGNGGLAYLTLVGPALSSTGGVVSTSAGVSVTGTGSGIVSLSHLRVSQFDFGIAIGSAGSALIGGDVLASTNEVGLLAGTGSTTLIQLVAGDPVTRFNSNFGDGITVLRGASSFTVDGPPQPVGSYTSDVAIGTSQNGQNGLQFAASAPGKGSIKGLDARENRVAGYEIFSGASLKVRGSPIHDNGVGVIILPTGSPPYDASGIDFGTDAAAGAGDNQIHSNTEAGLCVDPAVAASLRAASKRIAFQGNNFSLPPATDKLCTTSAPMPVLDRASQCAFGVDIDDDAVSVTTIDSCTSP